MNKRSKILITLIALTLICVMLFSTGCALLENVGLMGGDDGKKQTDKPNADDDDDGWTKLTNTQLDAVEVYKWLFQKVNSTIGGTARLTVGSSTSSVLYIDYSFELSADFKFALELKTSSAKTAKERVGIYFDGEFLYFKAIEATGKVDASVLMEKISDSDNLTIANLARFVNVIVQRSGEIEGYTRQYGNFEERKYTYSVDLQATYNSIKEILKVALDSYLKGMDISTYVGVILGVDADDLASGLTIDKNLDLTYEVLHEDNGGVSFKADIVDNGATTKNPALNLTFTSFVNSWTIETEDYLTYKSAKEQNFGVQANVTTTERQIAASIGHPEVHNYIVNLEVFIDYELFATKSEDIDGTGASELKLQVYDKDTNKTCLAIYLKESKLYIANLKSPTDTQLTYLSYDVDAGKFADAIKTIDISLFSKSIASASDIASIIAQASTMLTELNAALEAAIVMPEDETLDFWGDMTATFGDKMSKANVSAYLAGNKIAVSIDKNVDYIYVVDPEILFPNFVG